MIYLLDKLIILLTSPILMFLGAVICILKLSIDRGSIFFTSIRYSNLDYSFTIFKFKTMVSEPDIIQNEIKKFERDGFQNIPLSSIVYTKLGVFLERTQLVELPQVINILKGDMSIVGARPLPKENIEKLVKLHGHKKIAGRGLRKPGLAGTAQMMGKSSLDSKSRLEIELLENQFFCYGKPTEQIFYYFLIIFGNILYAVRRTQSASLNEIILKKIDKKNKLSGTAV